MTLPLVVPPSELVAREVTGIADRSGAKNDEGLVDIWVASQTSPHTRRAYRFDADGLLAFLARRGLQLRTMKVVDLQGWTSELSGSLSSQVRRIGAIKSLLTFGQETGYLTFNVGKVVKPPPLPNKLAERILSEREAAAVLEAAQADPIIGFMYASGARVSEACALRCGEVHEGPDAGATVTLHGKGGKTRHVVVAASVATVLRRLCEGQGATVPVFRTRTGRPLHPANVHKLVRRAARAANLDKKVSPHWLRHAHASHALDHGANPVLVRDSLGHESLATTSKYTHAKPGDGSSLYLPLLRDEDSSV